MIVLSFFTNATLVDEEFAKKQKNWKLGLAILEDRRSYRHEKSKKEPIKSNDAMDLLKKKE